jgi:serine/threonine protein kinase
MNKFPDFSNQGYRIIRELGRNREGGRITYLATHLNQDQQVVIKQFCFAQSDSSWSGFKAYEREIQVLRRLNHPGIPHYIDSYETSKGFCLVQEYKNARPLSEASGFEPAQIKKIAMSLLEIIVYIQSFIPPVFHRDIKPENILVDEEINVYLIDFGFSRVGSGNGSESSTILGTPGFMPPEPQHKLTLASDLYSVGATLICLITGTSSAKFHNLSDNKDPYRIQFKHLVPQLDPRFIRWLQKMVEPQAKNRFPNATKALAALKRIPVTHSQNQTPKAVQAIGVMGAVLLLGLGGILAYRYFSLSSQLTDSTSEIRSPLSPESSPQVTDSPQLAVEPSPSQSMATPTPMESLESNPLPTDSPELENEAKNQPTTNPAVSPTADPGNTVSQAFNLGILGDTRTYNDFVGSVDLEDYYRFELNTTSNVNLSLNSLSEYTYLELILDRNSNGQVDNGEVLNRSSSSASASINTPLGAGTYIFRVYPRDRNDNTTYTLEASATQIPTNPTDPGNSVREALDLGILGDSRTYNDFVGSVDLEDYYRFQLNSTSTVNLSLSSLSQYTYIELILDRNSNGQVDNGEVLNRSSSSASASINTPLGAGTYIFRVYPRDRNDNTTYTLDVAATEAQTN